MLNRTIAESCTPLDSSEADLTTLFDSFKAALRATEYPLLRFKTPMQRAASLCRLASSSKLAQNREVEIARLTSLLPHTMQTRLTIDLFSLLSRPLSVPIPPTLIADGAGLRLVTNKGASGLGEVELALEELRVEAERWNQERGSGPPQFVYRTSTSHPILAANFTEAKDMWKTHTGEQRLQLYIVPATTQATLLRAHWKLTKRAAVYYIVSSKSTGPGKGKTRLPSILKRIPEFSVSLPQSPKHHSPSFVNIKSPLSCWAVKRTTPIADIDRAIQEVVRVVELAYTQGKGTVEELVADFLPDCRKRWVLLSVKGCTFASATKAIIENLEQKQTIDLKFILFPLFNQKQALGQRLRDIKKKEEGARRMSFLGVNHMTTLKSETPIQASAGPTEQDPQPSRPHKCLGKIQETTFSQIVNNYDEMMGNIKRYKLEMQGATNFLQRYGGIEFWEGAFWRLRDRLRRDAVLGEIYSCVNPEEDRAMQRGLQRILEGNYNMYYKQTLLKIHRHLGVTSRQFACFLHAFEQVVCVSPVSPEDCSIILKRIKMLESCIVSL